jgi:P-type E1-E2 ATPase
MAFSISKMKEDNLLVKEMAASENLAYTNIICTGKTGTLTQGNIEVKEYNMGGESVKFDPENCNLLVGKHGEIIKSCIILNNDAKIEMCYDKIRKSAIY